MTIEKAVEILTDLLGEGPQFSPDDRRDAVKLGLEALKRVNEWRVDYDDNLLIHLAGETDR